MPTAERDVFPASYAQEGLWLLAQLAPDLPLYQVAVPLRLRLPVTRDGIEAVLSAIARRHETLRTTLELHDDALVQVVHAELPPRVEHSDLCALPAAERTERLMQTFYADMAAPLPPDAAPLWRARVIRCADDDWTVVVVAHHAVFDATSIMVLRRELRELAEASVTGRAPDLPTLPVQHADFAAWQRAQVADGAYDDDLRYWRDALAGAPPEHGLPADRPRPAAATFAGGAVHFVVPPDTVRGLHRVARRSGASPFMVLLAAYQALLARLSGDTDVVVGTLVAGRELPEVQPLIGMFVNTVVLRTRVSGDPPFVELVDRARGTLLAAWEHQAVPFDLVVAAIAPPRRPGRNPLFQIGLNYLPAHGSAGAGAEWTSLAHEESVTHHDGPRAARFDLHLDLTEDGDRLVGIFEYASDLFDRATVQAFAARFTRLLTAAVREPATRLSRLPLLTAGERARLLATRPRPSGPVSPLAVGGPPRVRATVIDGAGHRLAAGELDHRAAALATVLRGYGAGPDRPVAVLLRDGDAGLAIAVLGVLAAGAAVLPLDAGLAPQRLRFVLTDSRPAAVVSREDLRDRLAVSAVPVVCLDGATTGDPPGTGPSRPDPAGPAPDALAVVEYPVAVTGLPRAVGVTRAGLATQVDQAGEVLTVGSAASYALAPPVCPATLLATLAVEGTVHLPPSAGAAAAVSADCLVVSHSGLLDLLRAGGDAADWLPRRALLIDGGPADREDGTHWRPLRTALANRPGCAALRRFGHPETSGAALVRAVGGGGGALGRPLRHTVAYVFDADLEPVPEGAVGELYLGGAAVARGYLRRPGPTAARFVDDPHSPDDGARLFRTGIAVSRRRDGTFDPR